MGPKLKQSINYGYIPNKQNLHSDKSLKNNITSNTPSIFHSMLFYATKPIWQSGGAYKYFVLMQTYLGNLHHLHFQFQSQSFCFSWMPNCKQKNHSVIQGLQILHIGLQTIAAEDFVMGYSQNSKNGPKTVSFYCKEILHIW